MIMRRLQPLIWGTRAMVARVSVVPIVVAMVVLSVAGGVGWLVLSPAPAPATVFHVPLPARGENSADHAPPAAPEIAEQVRPPAPSDTAEVTRDDPVAPPDAPTTTPESAPKLPPITVTDQMGPVPHPALVEDGPFGPLPIIGADGSQAWQVYAKPFRAGDPRPRVAVVIGDLGLSRAPTYQATRLPGDITLSFAPYAEDLDEWIEISRTAGHEVVLQLPMEPVDYARGDPGPRALLTSHGADENLSRLDWLLSRLVGYVGVASFMGGALAESHDHLRPILTAVRDRGLLYFDTSAARTDLPHALSREIGLTHVAMDIDIDAAPSRTRIAGRLAALEEIAQDQGYAVALARPYPLTLEILGEWVPSLAPRGIAMAPLSAVAARANARTQ